MNYKLLIGVFLLIVVLFTGAAAADNSEIPPLPAQYYGTVFIDGKPASAGTTIFAQIGNETLGTITTTEPGVFGSAGTFGAKLLVAPASSDAEGSTITFWIGDVAAAETTTFKTGDAQNLSLTFAGAGTITMLKNTITDGTWNAETTAEILYALPPELLSSLAAPVITHNKATLMMKNISVLKNVAGVFIEVPASVSDEGEIHLKGDVSDTTELMVSFFGRKLGDVTGDGGVNTADKVKIGQYVAELTTLDEEALFYVDINGDTGVNTAEKIKVGQYIAEVLDANYNVRD